jgi:hypothetical protein
MWWSSYTTPVGVALHAATDLPISRTLRIRGTRQNARSDRAHRDRSSAATQDARGRWSLRVEPAISRDSTAGLNGAYSDLCTRVAQGVLCTPVVGWSCRSAPRAVLSGLRRRPVFGRPPQVLFACREARWAGDDSGAAYAGWRRAGIRRDCPTAAPRPTPSRPPIRSLRWAGPRPQTSLAINPGPGPTTCTPSVSGSHLHPAELPRSGSRSFLSKHGWRSNSTNAGTSPAKASSSTKTQRPVGTARLPVGAPSASKGGALEEVHLLVHLAPYIKGANGHEAPGNGAPADRLGYARCPRQAPTLWCCGPGCKIARRYDPEVSTALAGAPTPLIVSKQGR